MTMPRDFLDEVRLELEDARRDMSRNNDRIADLEGLLVVVQGVAAELDRPITVFDVIRTAESRQERARRLELVRSLRVPVTGSAASSIASRGNSRVEQ